MEDHPQGSSAPTSGMEKSITSVFDSVKNAVNSFVDSANRANFTTRQKVLETVDSLGKTTKRSLEGTGTETADAGHSSVSREPAAEDTIGDVFRSFISPIEKARLQARAAIDSFGEKRNAGVDTPSDRGDI